MLELGRGRNLLLQFAYSGLLSSCLKLQLVPFLHHVSQLAGISLVLLGLLLTLFQLVFEACNVAALFLKLALCEFKVIFELLLVLVLGSLQLLELVLELANLHVLLTHRLHLFFVLLLVFAKTLSERIHLCVLALEAALHVGKLSKLLSQFARSLVFLKELRAKTSHLLCGELAALLGQAKLILKLAHPLIQLVLLLRELLLQLVSLLLHLAAQPLDLILGPLPCFKLDLKLSDLLLVTQDLPALVVLAVTQLLNLGTELGNSLCVSCGLLEFRGRLGFRAATFFDLLG